MNAQCENEQLHRADLVSYIYDGYKDAHGIRPRWIAFDMMSVAELEAMADQVSNEVVETMECETREQDAAAVEFEARIVDLIKVGAGDRTTAIRWLMDAGDYRHGADALRYDCGLAWGYQL